MNFQYVPSTDETDNEMEIVDARAASADFAVDSTSPDELDPDADEQNQEHGLTRNSLTAYSSWKAAIPSGRKVCQALEKFACH